MKSLVYVKKKLKKIMKVEKFKIKTDTIAGSGKREQQKKQITYNPL